MWFIEKRPEKTCLSQWSVSIFPSLCSAQTHDISSFSRLKVYIKAGPVPSCPVYKASVYTRKSTDTALMA